jgi:F420H(2)-dependent quinone reductase
VIASNAGAPRDPFRHRNVVANPLVEVQDGAVKETMRAREVFGREKDEWWSGRTRLFDVPYPPSLCGQCGS